MSSTRMTRCGTPTVANAIQRSPGPELEPQTPSGRSGLAAEVEVRQPDLGLVARVRAAGLDHAGIGQQSEVAGRGELEEDRQPGAAERRVAAHGGPGAVGVPEGHAHRPRLRPASE